MGYDGSGGLDGPQRRPIPGLLGMAVLAVLLASGPTARGQPAAPLLDPRSVAPYVPTPWHVVDMMLEAARVSSNDTVYDLGSGDGRILVRAAKTHGARCVGFEIDRRLVEVAREAVAAAGVQDRVEIRQRDIFDADVGAATVVTLFLMTSANRELRPKLEEELKTGVRVVSYKWEIPGWNPSMTVTVPVSGTEHPIFVYTFGQHR